MFKQDGIAGQNDALGGVGLVGKWDEMQGVGMPDSEPLQGPMSFRVPRKPILACENKESAFPLHDYLSMKPLNRSFFRIDYRVQGLE